MALFYQLPDLELAEVAHMTILKSPQPKRYVFDAVSGSGYQDSAMRAWCTETFGFDPARWATDEWGLVAFRDSADAIAFKMRWM